MKEEGEKAGLKLSIKRTKTTVASQAALVVENLPASEGKHKRCSFHPWFGNISQKRAWQTTPGFLPDTGGGGRRRRG